jgi:hypothetical protein
MRQINSDSFKTSSNISSKFRETFETWPSSSWNQSKASGDIITVDGNALGASYLVISVDPLSSGTESFVDTVQSFQMPIELAIGAHLSQNAWGQDASIEFIDRDFITPSVADIEIASITQATTTLTVDTVLPHNLAVGKRIGIRDCSNAVANYPSLVIATVNSPTQFTCTGGPNSTIPSQTITNPVGAKGFVYFRPALSNSRNGSSLHFESSTATLGFIYGRASAGDAIAFGSGSGNAINARQATTVGTTASVALVSSPFTYSWTPTNEYRLTMMADRLQWSDALIDSVAASTNRLLRTQVVPNPSKDYFLRLKVRTEPSTTKPSAQIVTVSKAGATTATVTTDVPHGLVTGDLVIGYGVRDTGTGFYPALTTPAAVTVLTPTTFTVVWGTAATNTSYGGFVCKVNAACPLPGAISQSIQSAVKTTLVDGQSQIVLVGSANWSGFFVGDYVNLLGVRDTATGASIGIDGAWKVANISTTSLTLVNIPGNSPTVADFSIINCGGGVIKRTDFRISYARIFDFDRERVEILPRPTGDIANAAPVAVQNTPAVTVSSGTITTVSAVTAAGTPTAPATPYFLNSTASTNGNLIVTGTSGLQAFYATNTGAAVAYVKLYNKATAPTVGTDIPEMVIPIPAAVGGVPGWVELTPGFNAYRFALGLGIAITGGVADSDTTAVAAGQVKVKLSRTV